MKDHEIRRITNKTDIDNLGRTFRKQAKKITGVPDALKDNWWESDIADIAAAFDMIKSRDEAVFKELKRWCQKEYDRFNCGWHENERIVVVRIESGMNSYTRRFKYMRAALELMKLGNAMKCPFIAKHRLHIPKKKGQIAKPDAISFDHCIPQCNGIGAVNSPIMFCSREANQKRGNLKLEIWLTFAPEILGYADEIATFRRGLNKQAKAKTTPIKNVVIDASKDFPTTREVPSRKAQMHMPELAVRHA